VTGERVLSFHNVSVGETADPDLSGQYGRGKIPPWIPYWKNKPGSLGTEETSTLFKKIWVLQSSYYSYLFIILHLYNKRQEKL